MTLYFPNPSRSFDEVRNAVRFSGHDGMHEVRFFVDADALAKAGAAQPSANATEAECLSAFDSVRKSVNKAALTAYSRGRQPFYTLTAADFR